MRKTLPLLTLVLASSSAYADPWAYVQQTPGKPFPTIHVYSDDAKLWTRIGDQEAGLTFHVDARGSCDSGWRTQAESSLTVRSGQTQVGTASLSINTDNRSYGPGHGSGWKQHTFGTQYANPQGTFPAQLCNSWLTAESSAHANPTLRRKQLLAAGITRTVSNAYAADFALWCSKDAPGFHEPEFALAQGQVSAKVICHGNPDALKDPPARRDQVEQGIRILDVFVNPSSAANFKGFCPKTLHFGGEVDYLVPPGRTVNLRYRYVATSGARVIRSDYFTTVYNATGKKNLHSWSLDFPLTTGGPQFTAPTASGTPDVYGGSVVLEFDEAVQIHANLQPAQFNVTCLKKGVVKPGITGGSGTLTTPTPPRDPIDLGEPDPQPQDAEKPRTSNLLVTFPATIHPSATQQGNAGKASAPSAGDAPATATFAKPKADLVIREAILTADRSLRVRVANIGAGPSTPCQLTLYLPNGRPIKTTLAAVPAQGSTNVVIVAQVSLKELRPLRLRVDESGLVAESNEANNSYVLTSVQHPAN